MSNSKLCIVCGKKFYRQKENNFEWYKKRRCSSNCHKNTHSVIIYKKDNKRFCVDCNKDISDRNFSALRCNDCANLIPTILEIWRKRPNWSFEMAKEEAQSLLSHKETRRMEKEEQHQRYLNNLKRKWEFENSLNDKESPFHIINDNIPIEYLKTEKGEKLKKCSICGASIKSKSIKKLAFCNNCLKIKRKKTIEKFYDENDIIPEALELIKESRKISKEYAKEYRNRPEVKEKLRNYVKKLLKKPEVKEKLKVYTKNYLKRQDVKERLKIYARKYQSKKRREFESNTISTYYPIFYSFFIENKDDAFSLKELVKKFVLRRMIIQIVLKYLVKEKKIIFRKPYYSANISDDDNYELWKYFENKSN